jgi:hypothetical protein
VKTNRKNWKNRAVILSNELEHLKDLLEVAERTGKNDAIFIKMRTAKIAELECEMRAKEASVDERIRIALKEHEHKISALNDRVFSDAAHILADFFENRRLRAEVERRRKALEWIIVAVAQTSDTCDDATGVTLDGIKSIARSALQPLEFSQMQLMASQYRALIIDACNGKGGAGVE